MMPAPKKTNDERLGALKTHINWAAKEVGKWDGSFERASENLAKFCGTQSQEVDKQMHNENAPEVTAPERVIITQHASGIAQVNGESRAVQVSRVANPTQGAVGEYVLASKADAQADELRAEVEWLKALLKEAQISVGVHANEVAGWGGMDWMERRRRTDMLWALSHRIDAALGKPATAEQDGDDA
jgi:hypothetical protein